MNTEDPVEFVAVGIKRQLADLTEAVTTAEQAFAALPKKTPKAAPKPKRGKRPRSRQCRGKRRRNMLRATERSLEAKTGEQEVQTITREAQILGAILTPEPKP